MTTGFVHSIESFATFEGSGIRSAVFLQGCPLRCVYCHNPDTWSRSGGTEYSPQSLVKKLIRFRPYFGKEGGVTFSGGEPLMQAEFLMQCLALLNSQGINTAVDTSCALFNAQIRDIYSLCDTVIADLKFATREGYIKHCGLDVFDTVKTALDYLFEINKPVILRTVIVPGINDNHDFASQCFELTKGYTNIIKYEFKPFHTMGFDKYTALKLDNPLKNTPDADIESVNGLLSSRPPSANASDQA